MTALAQRLYLGGSGLSKAGCEWLAVDLLAHQWTPARLADHLFTYGKVPKRASLAMANDLLARGWVEAVQPQN